ncbi:MAG: glycosyltransferase, partial [Candidatus Krumholzibacteria bacterium]|nr:glycosyltransferase [Candidatus Krumholzibacteria bacterium]
NEFIRKEDLFAHLDELTDNMAAYIDQNGLNYELFHSHYWDAGYVAMNLSERMKVPFIHTAHSLGAWKKEQMGGDPEKMEKLFKFTERIHWENITYRKAAAQTVTTQDGLDNYKRLYDFESPDLIIIPPGVDTKRFRPLEAGEKDRDLNAPDKFVFALSRIDSNKGLDLLISAYAKIHDKTDADLVIGGGSKNPKPHEVEVKQSLENLVQTLGVQDRVRFTGYVPDELLDSYYRRAQVFVLPSKYEPFGMTVLEAMGCGTAVVATRLGGIRHVLNDHKDSLLVDPSDADEFGAALQKILTDRELASSLASTGLALIRSTFSWESIAKRTLDFYEQYA